MSEEKFDVAKMGPDMDSAMTAELTKDDSVAFISVLHGVSKAAVQGIDGARTGDFMLRGRTRVPGTQFGPGFARVSVVRKRPAAQHWIDNKLESKTNNPNSKEWAEIAPRARNFQKGYKVGFEFLLILHDHKCMGILYCANAERTTSAPKLIEAQEKGILVQVTTIISGAKNQVKLEVKPAAPTKDILWMPTKEQFESAVASFETYKTEKAAPAPAVER